MELVTVKEKFQIVIPNAIRRKVHVGIGDLLEAKLENGKITFTPKSVIDRHMAEGLEDMAHGRMHGPYKTAETAIAALEKKRTEKKRRKKKS